MELLYFRLHRLKIVNTSKNTQTNSINTLVFSENFQMANNCFFKLYSKINEIDRLHLSIFPCPFRCSAQPHCLFSFFKSILHQTNTISYKKWFFQKFWIKTWMNRLRKCCRTGLGYDWKTKKLVSILLYTSCFFQ